MGSSNFRIRCSWSCCTRFIQLMSVFKAAIVPRLETPPVISAMINASRNAITSFSIEMHSIQVGIALWRVIGNERQMSGTNALIDNKCFHKTELNKWHCNITALHFNWWTVTVASWLVITASLITRTHYSDYNKPSHFKFNCINIQLNYYPHKNHTYWANNIQNQGSAFRF